MRTAAWIALNDESSVTQSVTDVGIELLAAKKILQTSSPSSAHRCCTGEGSTIGGEQTPWSSAFKEYEPLRNRRKEKEMLRNIFVVLSPLLLAQR